MTTDGRPTQDAHRGVPLDTLLGWCARQIEQIETIARGQDELASLDDPAAFLDAVERRQQLIIAMIEKAPDLHAAIEQWRSGPDSPNPSTADQVRAIVESIDALAAMDRATVHLCEGVRDAAGRELSGLTNKSHATMAYAKEAPGGPRFQDREG